MLSWKSLVVTALIAQVLIPVSHAEPGPTFVPDATFKGSSLMGWHTVGAAQWTASNDVITGKGGEGWLVLDKAYQDSAMYTSFRCVGECKAGILMRLEKTPSGMTGVLLAIEASGLESYRVTMDASGKETGRTKLRNAGGQIRYAPPASKGGAAPLPSAQRPQMQTSVPLPIERPVQGIRKDGWNELEVLLDADVIRAFLNDGGGAASAATENMSDYGPMALYVGPGSEISFKDIAYKNLAIKSQPDEMVGKGFKMQRVNEFFYSWSSAAADFNHDGKMDIVSGPFIYYGPDFKDSNEIYPNEAYNTSTQYPTKDWVQHAADFTGDGWPDVLTTSHAGGGNEGAELYINPKGEKRRWEHHQVVPNVLGEETILKDIDGDGKPDLIYTGGGYMRWAQPDPKNPTGMWIEHTVSEKGPWPAHGIGAGDINGDGKVDILGAEGWWEQPKADDSKPWKYHPVAFGVWGRTAPGGSEMGVYDVNGDGLADVVTSLEAHGWGLAWFEQKRDKSSGEISFVRHMVMGMYGDKNAGGVTFSEPHGTTIADVDGDGIPDFIVGKRLWSHLDDFYDPDPYGPAVLYWYKTVRNSKAPGGAELIPQLIHNRSGVGSDVLAVDLNGDGKMDVITTTRSGTYIFWGQGKAAK